MEGFQVGCWTKERVDERRVLSRLIGRNFTILPLCAAIAQLESVNDLCSWERLSSHLTNMECIECSNPHREHWGSNSPSSLCLGYLQLLYEGANALLLASKNRHPPQWMGQNLQCYPFQRFHWEHPECDPTWAMSAVILHGGIPSPRLLCADLQSSLESATRKPPTCRVQVLCFAFFWYLDIMRKNPKDTWRTYP